MVQKVSKIIIKPNLVEIHGNKRGSGEEIMLLTPSIAKKEDSMIMAIIGGQEGECMGIFADTPKIRHNYKRVFLEN